MNLPKELVEKLFSYLITKPYAESADFIFAIQKAAQEPVAPVEKELDETVETTYSK